MKRKIIRIDENKCNGCGLCLPNCPEGAIQIIDNKARLISDLFCDGLGACIGYCPQGAITIEERQAEEYSEEKVMKNIIKQGPNVITAHLKHLKEHNQDRYLKQALDFLKKNSINIPRESALPAEKCGHGSSCPGSKIVDLGRHKDDSSKEEGARDIRSELSQWPVQIMLIPAHAPFLQDADVLVSADCVPFAYANFHQDLLKGKILLVGCPKLDDIQAYRDKFTQMLSGNNIKSITYAHMEVPCCFGLVDVIKKAIIESGKQVPFKEVTISIKGERLS